MDLKNKHCRPCEDGAEPMSAKDVEKFNKEIGLWNIIDSARLEKTFTFKDFGEALTFVNKVGEIAESEGHHPNIYLFDYKKVKIELYTHSVNGLSENDFILASRINEL